MRHLTYNIHDLLKIRVTGDNRFDSGKTLKYLFFESEEEISDPDITLNIGKFEPLNIDCDFVARKYYIKENYIYCKDKGKKMKWEVEIFGFEKGNTVINFNGKDSGLKGILFPSFLSQDFLIPLIEYKLAEKNHFLLHAGAVSKDSNAYVFAGRMGTYKTTLIMDLIRRANFDYLGDDRVIINKDEVLCFPTSLFLFEFMLNSMRTEKRSFLDNIHLFKHILTSKNENKVPIVTSSKLKGLFFISRADRNNVRTTELPSKKGIDKLILNNKAEFVASTPTTPLGQFYKYILVYSLIFPENKLAKHWDVLKKGMEDALRDIPIYEIEMPRAYNINVFNETIRKLNKYDKPGVNI